MTEWRDISTAPKDGTWFLAYRGEARAGTWDRFVIVRWHDEFQDFIWPDNPFDIFRDDIDEKDSRDRFVISPYEAKGSFSHWMPLPERPARLGTAFPGNEAFDDEPGRA